MDDGTIRLAVQPASPAKETMMAYVLKGGEEWRNGVLYGWTGLECPKCAGTGEDWSDKTAPNHACHGCGGTGEGWGMMPVQPTAA